MGIGKSDSKLRQWAKQQENMSCHEPGGSPPRQWRQLFFVWHAVWTLLGGTLQLKPSSSSKVTSKGLYSWIAQPLQETTLCLTTQLKRLWHLVMYHSINAFLVALCYEIGWRTAMQMEEAFKFHPAQGRQQPGKGKACGSNSHLTDTSISVSPPTLKVLLLPYSSIRKVKNKPLK